MSSISAYEPFSTVRCWPLASCWHCPPPYVGPERAEQLHGYRPGRSGHHVCLLIIRPSASTPPTWAARGGATVAFTIGEAGAGVSSQSLTRQQLRKFIYDTQRAAHAGRKAGRWPGLLLPTTPPTSMPTSPPLGWPCSCPSSGAWPSATAIRTAGHVGLNQNAAEITFLGRNAPIYTATAAGNIPLVSEALAGTRNPVFGPQRIQPGLGYAPD